MEYLRLGRSGLRVAPVTLGTMNVGTGPDAPCDEAEARRIVDAYLDAGGNVIDTADGYTGGQSEEVVGRAVRGRRDDVVLATKAFMPQGDGPNHRGLSRLHLTRALDASLRRLGTDHVDIYQCHGWDPATPIEETMAALDGFVRSGKVRYLGCSNFTPAQVVEAQWAAARSGGSPLVSLQPHYSLLARAIEAEILPACERHGLGTLIYGPLGGGVLAGRYRLGAEPEAGTRLATWAARPEPRARRWRDQLLSDRSFAVAAEVAKVAAELGTTPTAVAVSWVAARPGVTSVVVGPRTLAQLEDNLAGAALDLPAQHAARLDEVSGPPTSPVTGMFGDPAAA
jgi:aryl-alcohol dehydrogenase-like predicted oxidoreductase